MMKVNTEMTDPKSSPRIDVSRRRRIIENRRLPAALKIGHLEEPQVELLLHRFKGGEFPLSTDKALSQRTNAGLPTDEFSSDGCYEHYEVQSCRPTGNSLDASEYRDFASRCVERTVTSVISNAYRTRLGVLSAGCSLPKHIDDPLHYRFISILEGENEFWIEVDNAEQLFDMKIGEVWFVNTSFPHYVRNTGPGARVALLTMSQEIPVC